MLDIPPDQEQTLRQRAQQAGQDVETYLLQSVGLGKTPSPLPDEEWERLLNEFGNTAPLDAPLLSDYAVSREGIYEGRD